LDYKNQKNTEQDNDWAKNLEGDYIHISQAQSGAQGYYCLGCDKETLAAKGLIKKHYFRHVVKDADNSKKECVNSSREYREKLAYYYFMRVKKINLPAIYKYPPKGFEGLPYLLEEKQTIHAHRVDREVTFFEDENGVIHSGKNTDVDERYLWIRPDAVFYDANDKPILFVEFIVSHKPDTDKINKLRRLGINTVQIIVPKKTEEELEKEISKASKVKWTYNEIESDTEYIPVSKGNSEGVPPIDEEQRKLFEESFACRRAQVENLIRSITRCMESQQYRRTAELFGQEISRIEEATKRERTRLEDLQEGIEREIDSELGERREELKRKCEKFRKHKNDVETRYYRKRDLLREEQEDTDYEIEFRYRVGSTEDEIRGEFEREERKSEIEETNIDSEQKRIRGHQTSIIQDIEENRTFENNHSGEKDILREEFEGLRDKELKDFEGKRNHLESKITGFGDFKTEVEDGIRSEFEREYQQIAERVNNRDVQSGDELSERIKSILELRGFFDSYSNGQTTIEDYRKGLQLIKSGTWKEWD
jgi:hypothetical protein